MSLKRCLYSLCYLLSSAMCDASQNLRNTQKRTISLQEWIVLTADHASHPILVGFYKDFYFFHNVLAADASFQYSHFSYRMEQWKFFGSETDVCSFSHILWTGLGQCFSVSLVFFRLFYSLPRFLKFYYYYCCYIYSFSPDWLNDSKSLEIGYTRFRIQTCPRLVANHD